MKLKACKEYAAELLFLSACRWLPTMLRGLEVSCLSWNVEMQCGLPQEHI